MGKIVRLTESELKNIIMESVKNILREGQNDEPSNTHYAIHKPSNKIVFSWDYSGYDPEDLKIYKHDYFVVDLLDMEMDPKQIAIWTRRSCVNKGIDPSDDANWSNYPMTESLLKEYGDTDKGQEMLGKAAGRAQKRAQKIGRSNDYDAYCDMMGRADKIGNYARDQRIKSNGKPDDKTGAFTKGVKDGKEKEINETIKRILREFNSVLPYGNHSSSEQIKGEYEINPETILIYVSDNIDETAPIYSEIKEIIEYVLDGATIGVTGTFYREEDTNYSAIEDVDINSSDVETYLSEIDAFEQVSDESKEYVKQALMDAVKDIDGNDNDINWGM